MKLFDDDQWAEVAQQLRWGAYSWWRKNRSTIVGMAESDIQAIALQLKAGNRTKAKLALVRLMTREEWNDYVNATTNELASISSRRANMLISLEKLGWWAARIVGAAVLGAIGL